MDWRRDCCSRGLQICAIPISSRLSPSLSFSLSTGTETAPELRHSKESASASTPMAKCRMCCCKWPELATIRQTTAEKHCSSHWFQNSDTCFRTRTVRRLSSCNRCHFETFGSCPFSDLSSTDLPGGVSVKSDSSQTNHPRDIFLKLTVHLNNNCLNGSRHVRCLLASQKICTVPETLSRMILGFNDGVLIAQEVTPPPPPRADVPDVSILLPLVLETKWS